MFKRGRGGNKALIVNPTECSFWGVKLLAASLQGPDSSECSCLPFFLPNIGLLLLFFSFSLSLLLFLYLI